MTKHKTLTKRYTTKSDGIYFKLIVSNDFKDTAKTIDINELLKASADKLLNKVTMLDEEKLKIIDLLYLIRWRDDSGKDRLKNIGKYSAGIREAYCKAKRDEIVVKQRLGEESPHLAKKKSLITLDTLAYQYFNENMTLVKDMPKEQKRYENHIKDVLGHIKADNIKLTDIKNLRNKFMEEFSPRTVNHLIFLIGTIYKYNIKNEYYKGVSPTANFEGLEVKNERDKYLTLDEIDKLLEACWASSYEVLSTAE